MPENINKKPFNAKSSLSAKDYFNGIKNKNRALLSKGITLIESSKPEHQKIAEELIALCLPISGNSLRIGISGVPGVGKSTFIESFGSYLIANKNKKVAVLAIDPSSNKSGGSILGDKTRMTKLSVNENAFIRPSPTSGALGGVSKATRESIILCEAAGFDAILVETVGVGQSEIEVKSMVDFFLLLMLPGAGDELQGIKRGIMEIADAVFINKADAENVAKVKLAVQEYTNAIHLFPANDNGWTPKVSDCSAIENRGMDTAYEIIENFVNLTHSNGSLAKNRKQQSKFWLEHTINSLLKEHFYSNENVRKKLKSLEEEVVNGKITPFKAAHDLLKIFKS